MNNLLIIYVDETHIHGMDRCENVGGALNNTFSSFWHSDWCTRGQEYWFVTAAQRKK